MEPARPRRLVIWGSGGLLALVLLAGITAAAIYLSTAFVIGYARVPEPSAPALGGRPPGR